MYEKINFLGIFILVQGKASSPGSPASPGPENQVFPCTRIKIPRKLKFSYMVWDPCTRKKKFRIPEKSSEVVHQEL